MKTHLLDFFSYLLNMNYVVLTSVDKVNSTYDKYEKIDKILYL